MSTREVTRIETVPFPHVVVDDWWDHDLLCEVVEEFPDPSAQGWRSYRNGQERKLEGPPILWGPSTQALFDQIGARGPVLEALFGIDDLTMETIGGGYHLIEPGGYLQVHSDFSVSPSTRRFRRLNLLVYLNEDWQDEGGHLDLWDDAGPCVSVAPEFNRTVVFETSARSWHGHPNPAKRWRKSVAAYFFTEAPPADYAGDQSTVWHPGVGG